MENAKDRSDTSDLRQRILDATRHLLVQDGYASLSMRRIARAVGCSPTSIYLYFDDKNALFHTLIDEGFSQLYRTLKHLGGDSTDDPVQHLERICRGFVDFGLDNPEYYEIMFMLHPERMERYPPQKYRQAHSNLEYLTNTLAEGQEQGVFNAPKPRVAAGTIWASLHGVVSVLIARRVDVRIAPDAFVETALRQIVAGVLAVGVKA